MIVGHRYCIAFGLWASILIVVLESNALAQEPATPPPPSQPQSAAPADPGAQIDQLIKKANEQVNAQGHMKEAEETAQQAVDLSRKLGDKARTMQAMLYLGSAYYYQGRLPEALEAFQQVAALAREIGNRKGLSRALNNAAAVLRDVGRYEDSLSYFYQVLALCRELKDLPMQWTASRNIGVLYLQLGETEKAEGPLKESLRISYELKDEPGKSLVKNVAKVTREASLETLGEWEMDRQHYAEALDYYATSLASKPENPSFRAELLANMAAAHEKLGESRKSVELLHQAMKIWESTGTPTNPLMVSALGYSQESLGQLNEALASQQRALALVRQSGGNPQLEWQFESRMAHVERALGRNQEALAHCQNSISGLELLRPGALNTESGRASILAKSRAAYAETADLLVDLHREAEALEIAERGRARAFLDMLAQSRARVAAELTPEQAKREEAILARITAAQKELWKEALPAKEEQQRKAKLSAAEDDLESFHLEVRHANPRYASIRYPEPINVGRIQKDLLGANTVLLEFLLGEKRSLVWAVTKAKLDVGVLPGRKDIEVAVEAYRKALTEKTSVLMRDRSLAEIGRRGKELYSMLLEPVESALAPGRSMIIVPDGALSYLPFETLILRGRRELSGEKRPSYLIEEFPIVYAPSASALAAVKESNREQSEPPRTLLAFGDPIVDVPTGLAKNGANADAARSSPREQESKPEMAISAEYAERGFSVSRLPFTKDEVLGISRLYPATLRKVYLGGQAREETVKSERLDEYHYVHFATHGFIDEVHPGRSGILFSREPRSMEDGVLQMGEIVRLRLNADLVTLSACSTGLGKLVGGEGILGLTRAFFYAGARNVAVSLWNVNDSATAALMKAFYQNLNRDLPKAAALRQAKLNLLRGKDASWRHPYFWAAFVLVGEGR